MKKALVTVIVILAAVGIILSACSKKRTVPVAPEDLSTATFTHTFTNTPTATDTWNTSLPTYTFTNTATYTNTATPTATNPPVAWPAGHIDDCEDTFAPNASNFNGDSPFLNVGGYWITYDDRANSGTSYVWPMSADWAVANGVVPDKATFNSDPQYSFQMSSPGYTGSTYGTAYAARLTGFAIVATTLQTDVPDWAVAPGYTYGFIGMGVQLTVTAGEDGGCQKVDISGYTGIKFWTKGDGKIYHIKLPYTKDTLCDTKDVGSYTGHNDYKVTFTAEAAWTLLELPFTAFKQATGWGTIVPLTDVLQAASQIQFQTHEPQANYEFADGGADLWIDDIEFYY